MKFRNRMDRLFLVLMLFSLILLETEGRKCTRPCVCGKRHFKGISSKQSVFVMDCSGRFLFYAPHVHGDVQVLDLSSNMFEEYPAALMASNIKALLLDNNNITTIPDVPSSDSYLRYLDLSGNNVQLAEEGFPPGFTNLETLKIWSTILFDDSLMGLPHLKELHLTVLNDSFPSGLLATPDIAINLRKLVLKTETIPPNLFHSLRQIKDIQLYLGDGITELPNAVFDVFDPKTMKTILINASHLQISDRQLLMYLEELSEITLELEDVNTLSSDVLYKVKSGTQCDKPPDTCRQEQNRLYLEKIIIRGVKQLPHTLLDYVSLLDYLEITGMERPSEGLLHKTSLLRTLKLRHDNIEAITPALLPIPMTALTHFNLSYNVIKEINENDFEPTPNLEILDLSHNLIHSIHENAFHGLGNLMYLNLSHNNICQLPSTVFHFLTSLNHLHHQFNCLGQLEPNLFQNLRSLSHLYLQVNSITQIPDGLFANMEKLEFLNLNGNKIVGLSKETLEYFYNSNLERVDLSGNDLRSFPVFNPPEKTNLEYFIIGNNPNLHCGCGMVPLIKLIHTEGFCAKPEELKGTKISDLEPEELCLETTQTPTTGSPTSEGPTNEGLTTECLTTEGPTTKSLTTEGPTTEDPTTVDQNTDSPTTGGRSTVQPTAESTTRENIKVPIMSSTIESSITEIPTDPVTSPELVEETFTVDLIGKLHPCDALNKNKTTSDTTVISAPTSSASNLDVHSGHCIDFVTYKPVDCRKEGSAIMYPNGTIEKFNMTVNITIYVRHSASVADQKYYSDLFPWWIIGVTIIGLFFLVGMAYAIFKQRGKMYERSYTVNHI